MAEQLLGLLPGDAPPAALAAALARPLLLLLALQAWRTGSGLAAALAAGNTGARQPDYEEREQQQRRWGWLLRRLLVLHVDKGAALLLLTTALQVGAHLPAALSPSWHLHEAIRV